MKMESDIYRPDKDSEKFEKSDSVGYLFRNKIKEIVDSNEYFLGKGAAAEVHEITHGNKHVCVKIHTDLNIMARDKNIDFVPEQYKNAFLLQQQNEEDGEVKPWRQSCLQEAATANTARKLSDVAKVPQIYRVAKTEGSEVHDGCWIEEKKEILIMEQIDGFDLEQVIQRGVPLPEGFDLEIFCDKLEQFIDEINAQGIYHRDLAPRNVMINLQNINQPVVIDFGRATQFGGNEPYVEESSAPGKPDLRFLGKDDELAKKFRKSLRECIDK